MYLLDTHILSRLLVPGQFPVLARRFSREASSDLYTSAINRGELLYGLLRAGKGTRYFLRLQHLMEQIHVLSFDVSCADVYGQLRADLERNGTAIPDLDLMIASVALSNQLTVVTANERHFRIIPGIEVENWLRET